MKIYFINPPADEGVKQVREGRCMQRAGAWTAIWTPISLALCAAVVRKEGIEVKLTDCIVEDISFPHLQKMIEGYRPELVVINAVTPSIESDLSTVRWIKKIDHHIKTAVIGIHGTALPDNCFEIEPELDYVVRGEPEYTVCDIALAIRDSKEIPTIAGISYQVSGEIFHNQERAAIKNLDELPFPAWDLIRRDKYRMPFTNKKFLLVATSRGCPYRCTFCADNAYYGKKLRLKSPQRVVDELAWDKEKFGIDEFLFWTESFTINKEFSQDVAEEIIKRGLKVSWVCNSRVDNVDKDMLKRFKEAGCWMIGYGVESGNQRVLDSVNKEIKLEQTVQAINLAKACGLDVTAHCILGFPGETKETVKQTIRFVKKLDIDFAQFYCAVPFPGSELYNLSRKKGWINTSNWRRFEQNYSVLNTGSITAEEIMRLRSKAIKAFYLRPKIIFRTLRRIKSWTGLKKFISMVKDFLTWV